MTATAPHSRLHAVGRLVLLVAAIALTVWGISLVAFSNSMRNTRVGIPIAFWGVLAGYAAIRVGNARTATSAPGEEGSTEAVGEVEVRASAEVVRERDEAARREYEVRLELMLRRELEQGLREELAALRRDVAELRGDVLDAVDGRLRMERVEITRIIGSNLAALHDDGRISLNPAADVTVPAPGSDEPVRARDAEVGRDASSTWTSTTTSAGSADPTAQWLPRSGSDATAPGGWFDRQLDRPAPSAPTMAGSGGATKWGGSAAESPSDLGLRVGPGRAADPTVDADPAPSDRAVAVGLEPAPLVNGSRSETMEPQLVETGPGQPEWSETEPAESEPAESEPAESEPAESEPAEQESIETEPAEPAALDAELEPETAEPGFVASGPAGTDPAAPAPAETTLAETGPGQTEPVDPKLGRSELARPGAAGPERTEPVLAETEPQPDADVAADAQQAESPAPVATAEPTTGAEADRAIPTGSSAMTPDGPPAARPAREDPFANLPRLSSFRLPDLPEGVSIASAQPPPETGDPEPIDTEPVAALPGGGYVGRRRHAVDDDASAVDAAATGRHGAGADRSASSASVQGQERVPASRHRG